METAIDVQTIDDERRTTRNPAQATNCNFPRSKTFLCFSLVRSIRSESFYLLVIEPAGLAAHHEVTVSEANIGFVPHFGRQCHDAPNGRKPRTFGWVGRKTPTSFQFWAQTRSLCQQTERHPHQESTMNRLFSPVTQLVLRKRCLPIAAYGDRTGHAE